MTQEILEKDIRSLCRELESNKVKDQPFERYKAYQEGIENEIINTVNRYIEYLKEAAKRGGAARKAQKPDYSAMGKKGMAKRWQKTSVMHKDIGEHEHEVTIFDSYQTYAVCKKCGMHDWDAPEDDSVDYLKRKYPQHEIVDINEELRGGGD